jgi:excisionase family DNA binding protein
VEELIMLMSTKEIAEQMGYSVSQVRRLIASGYLKAERVGTYFVINPKDAKKVKRRRSPNGTRKSKDGSK